jgi:hypothetical protein
VLRSAYTNYGTCLLSMKRITTASYIKEESQKGKLCVYVCARTDKIRVEERENEQASGLLPGTCLCNCNTVVKYYIVNNNFYFSSDSQIMLKETKKRLLIR